MLEPLLGSKNAERVLVYILTRNEGYGREIARFFDSDADSIQKQLVKFELGGIFVSNTLGRTRLYSFNPRYPFLKELKTLLKKAIRFYPMKDREKLLMNRRRPRRSGKPFPK